MPVEDRIEDAAPEAPEPYDAPEPPARRRRRTFGALLIAAAAIAVVALAAHVYWQRGAGGAGGDIPLLRAEPGPARERPSDPGGMTVPYRDLLALHELGAPGGETGEPVVERLLPPPETPLPRPRRADVPPDAPPPVAPPAAAGAEIEIAPAPPPPSAGAAPEVREPQITPTAAPPAGTPIAPTAAALTEGAPAPEEGARGEGIVEEIVVAAEPPPSDSPPDETAAAEAPPAPPARKPDPPPRREAPDDDDADADDAPQTIEDILALAAEPGTAVPNTAVPDTAIPDTGFAVQLGAYRTEEEAEQAWDNAVERAPEVLGPARHFIAQADLGGGAGVVHRLRIGPLPGRGGADDLCRRLQGAGIACFTVEP